MPEPELPRDSAGTSVDRALRRERIIAGSIAVIFGAVGFTATFTTDNELGTAALLVVAGVFGACAAFGLVPTRLKVGDNEVAVGRAALHTLEEVMREAPGAVGEQALETFENKLSDQGVTLPNDEAVASMIDRFVRYSGSELAREIHDYLGRAGWVPSTPGRSTYVRWTYVGSKRAVTLYQNSAQVLVAANRLVDLLRQYEWAVLRSAKNELVVSYDTDTTNAIAASEILKSFANGQSPG